MGEAYELILGEINNFRKLLERREAEEIINSIEIADYREYLEETEVLLQKTAV